jgi:hypothetical protein
MISPMHALFAGTVRFDTDDDDDDYYDPIADYCQFHAVSSERASE